MIAKSLRFGLRCWTLGVRCLVLGAQCMLVSARCLMFGTGCWMMAAAAHAQAPITNAKVDMRSAAQGVDRVVQSIAATRSAAWIGYRLAAAPGARRTCGGYGPRVLLEPPSEFYVLARMEAGEIVRIRSFTPECDIDAGGLPLVWLTDLKPADGVAWLVQMARTSKDSNIKKAAVSALVRSGDPSATKFFEELLTGK